METDCDVVVVGAGYAGLIAARNLITAGKSVVVLEAGNRVGGRAWSETFPGNETIVDWGAEWVLPEHHHALMAEAKRYGVALEPMVDAPLPRWQIGDDAFNSSFADMVAANPGVQKILNRLETTPADYAQHGDESSKTLADVLVHETARDAALVNAALFPLTGADPDALALSMVLDEICFHGGTIAETIDPAEIARLQGGTGEIAKRMAAELPLGTIRFGCAVDTVLDQGHRMSTLGEFGNVTSHKVILALPLNVLKNIAFALPLPEPLKTFRNESHAGRTMKIWALASGKTLPEECFIAGHMFKLTYAKPAGEGGVLICAQALVDEAGSADEAELKATFEGLYPGHKVLSIFKHDWVSDPLALGSWHAGRPGQEAALRAMREPIGKVIFCGGDFNDPWSGWIEGAILSGAKAARTFS